jgi:tetratricopeptide (TPR) repeat protein
MNTGRMNSRLPRGMRPLVVILLYVCAAAAISPPPFASQSSEPEPFPQSAWTAIAHGRTADAEAQARARPADDASAAAVLAHIAMASGKHDEALAMLEPAAARAPAGDAAVELGLLLQRVGRMQAASEHLQRVLRHVSTGASDGASVYRAARAAHALGRVQDANSLYRSAAAPRTTPAIETAWGTLFLETHNHPEAVKSFQQALKLDPQWAPAHVGLARTLSDDDPPAAAAAAERALEIDPRLASAHRLLAELDLDNTRYEQARERIDRVLAANPQDLDALSLVAAIAYVKDDRAKFDAGVKHVLGINPAFGEVYRVAAQLAAQNYRFEEAVVLSRDAIALDPTNHRAHAELGMHLMRTGDEAEAKRSLDRAHNDFPFNRVTYNLLLLLDKLEKFTVVEDDEIILKMDPGEAPVIKEYALPLAKEALRTLSARYGFTPKLPILVEIFPVHDDFAVRTLGLPGMIGALGACFGRVVTLDSPKARPPGTFSWQATLWHEMAHVITLQMSRQRVPRWLTEGISVHEEMRARPEWGRDMEVPFALALERGKALKLRDLNSGFTQPDTIALAYFQAALLVDHIASTHGEAKLQALVRSYGEGLEGEAAVTKTLGASFDQLQASFDKALDVRFASVRAALQDVAAGRGRGALALPGGEGAGVEQLRAAAAARPGSYVAQLALGRALAAAGDRAAFEPLEKAAALVPMATGEDSPHAIMAKLAERLGDTARAVKEYRLLLAQDHTTIDHARSLAALAEKIGDESSLALAHDRIVALDPFDPQAHTGLGRLAVKRKDAVIAMREFRAALAAGPIDRAAAHCDLGESYLLAGRLADAKREALAALEIAPSFERAQDLLLKTIGGGRP